MQWMLTPIAGQNEARLQLIVMPEPTTEYIHGTGMWRVGLFSAASRDGSGVRQNYVRQVLNEYEAARDLTASSPLRFDLNTHIDLREVGCGNARYLCLEFAKGDRPRPNFNLPIANNHFVDCKLYRCTTDQTRPPRGETPGPRPGPNPRPRPNPQPTRSPILKVARLSNFRWNVQPDQSSASDVTLQAWITPSPRTDYIHGEGLWRLGLYGSESMTGSGTKVGYQRQVLDQQEAAMPMHAAAPLEFTVRTTFDVRRIGCDDVRYLCVEFGKGDAPIPNFKMPLPGGDSVVSCQPSTCQAG
ncbi:uncharacterized protein [Diadema antillarum]|uniref:uncharacterized protein n=1 Tax=Diadema antillarum TaxID=105358 RepID=UPI003A8483C1